MYHSSGKVSSRPTLRLSLDLRIQNKVLWFQTLFRIDTQLCSTVNLLIPHVPPILDLLQRCFNDEERSDSLVKYSYGLLGDLADSFAGGQIKNYLLQSWIAAELRGKHRMSAEAKKTMRWAREVCARTKDNIETNVLADGQSRHPIDPPREHFLTNFTPLSPLISTRRRNPACNHPLAQFFFLFLFHGTKRLHRL